MAAPLLLVAETGGKLFGSDPTAHLRQHPPRALEKTLASLIAALACLALVVLGLQVTGRLAPALLVGCLYAFGTAMWSTVSRGLWQHGPLILLVTVGLISLERARRREDWRWATAAGLTFGAGSAKLARVQWRGSAPAKPPPHRRSASSGSVPSRRD